MSFGFGDLASINFASPFFLFNWCVFALMMWNDAASSNSKLTMASFQVAAAAAASRGMFIITSNTISCRLCHLQELS